MSGSATMACGAATSPARVERVSDSVAALVLDCPERGNALSAELVEALLAGLENVLSDPGVDTLAFCASGRHFCTGFDLSGLDAETDASLLARFVRIETLLDAIWRAPVRTVAIAQGRIIGAGADLFAACDFRWLASGASLRFPGAGFGLVLGTRRLAARVGRARALRWVSEATVLDAEEAVAAGLADEVLAPGSLAGAPGEQPAALAARLPRIGVDRGTMSALRGAMRDHAADRDLAALVRSAARPGLKARIAAYRAAQLEARGGG